MRAYNVISADSHVIEPPDLWLRYIAPAFRDRAPRGVSLPDRDVFEGEGISMSRVGLLWCAPGKPKTELRIEGRFSDAPPSVYEATARLQYQDQDGVDAEVIYPTVTMRMFSIPDSDLMHACLEAYNTGCAEFCAAAPDRLKAPGMIALDNVEHGILELRRVKRLGLAGAAIPISPGSADWYAGSGFDRFWAEAQDLEIPVSLHVLTERVGVAPAVEAQAWQRKHASGAPMLRANVAEAVVPIQKALQSIILTGVLERFPRLQLVSAESGAGWAVHFLERMDEIVREQTAILMEHGLKGGLLPSEYFHRNVSMTFIRDRNAVRCRDVIGVENMMWSSDFPHPNGTFPRTREVLAEHFAGVPDADRHKIVAGNAMRLYGFGR